MWSYSVSLTRDDNDTILAQVIDVPGAISFGEDEAEALENVRDALETVLSGMIGKRQDIPRRSADGGSPTVTPTLLGSLKLTVYEAMRARGWKKADLAREMDVDPRIIDRLLDLRHSSRIEQIERALKVCGRQAEVESRELAHA